MDLEKIDLDNLEMIIKEGGYKLTNQRVAILEVLAKNIDDHLSCEEIHDEVKKNMPEIGIATIYRTMQILEKLNIAYRLNFDDGFSRYELKLPSNGVHQHLICLECGLVTEVKLKPLENIEKEIEEIEGFEVKDHNLKFYGICKNCKNK